MKTIDSCFKSQISNLKFLTLPILLFCVTIPAFTQTKKSATKRASKTKAVKVVDFSQTYDDKWLFYGTSADGEWNYYNPHRASQKGNVLKVWTEQRDFDDKNILSREHYEINCSTRTLRSLAGVAYYRPLYYADGRKEWVKTQPESWDTPDAKFKTIIPDSVGDLLAEVACKLDA